MPPNPRIVKAFKAMKAIGIDEPTTKPVLKRLLKLYDKNWELIEAEDYRALADAIFEEQDAQVSGSGSGSGGGTGAGVSDNGGSFMSEVGATDETEPPFKRLRKGHAGETSSPSANCNSWLPGVPLIKPKEEKEELPCTNYTLQSPDKRRSESLVTLPHNHASNMGKQPNHSHEPLVVDKNLPPESLSPQNRHAYKGKEPLVPQFAVKEKRPMPGRASTGVVFKDPVVESRNALVPKENAHDTLALVVHKDEPFTDNMHQYLPLAVFPPGLLAIEGPSTDSESMGKRDALLSSSPSHILAAEYKSDNGHSSSQNVANGEVPIILEGSAANLEIATSTMGEVKIYLSCNSIIGKPNCHMPTQEELLKSVEEKCLRSYKILDPNFSVMKVLKDMCECFLELATDSSRHSQEESLLNVTPRGNLLKKPAAYGGVGNSSPATNTSNGSVHASHVDVVAVPEASVLSQQNMLSGNEAAARGCSENKEGQGLRDLELCDSVAISECQLTPDEFRSLHCMNDITKAEEAVEIPWLNEITKECLPRFNYTPRNLVFQNARLKFTLSQIKAENCCSRCVGDCLSSSKTCICSLGTMHGFAYTRDGLVKEDFLEDCISMNRDTKRQSHSFCSDCPIQRAKGDGILEPCQGHLNRKYIKECWIKCGCHKLCGNRVVQRGIRYKLQVFFTPEGKGWGLRTLEKLPKGAFVCEYAGEILTTKEFFERKMEMSRDNKKLVCPAPLDAYWSSKSLEDEEALCLDATFHGNVARFINHRCHDANLIEIPVKIETPDDHYYHLAFFTTREVIALEELTLDYGTEFDDDTVDAFKCLCCSKFCRDMRRSNGSKSRAN